MLKKCLSLILLVQISSCFSQNNSKIDSLLKVYKNQLEDSLKVLTCYKIYDFYYGHKPKLALKYSKEGLQLAQNINYKPGIAKSFYHHGRHLRNLRKLDSATFYFDKAFNIYISLDDTHEQGLMILNNIIIDYFKSNYTQALATISENLSKYSNPKPDSIVIMDLLQMRGRIFMRQTKYKQGIESALKALGYSENLKNENKKAQITSLLASLYHYTNNKEKAIELKLQALKIYQEQNRKRQIANALNDIGNSYYGLKKYDLALQYFEKSIPVSRALELNGQIGIATFNIGKTHIKKGDIKKGIEFLEESIHYSRHITNNPLTESWALKKLGRVYTEELHMPKKAILYINRAIMLADSVGNKDDLYQSYRDRSQAYEALGNYKTALIDHKSYKAINDNVYNIEKTKEIDRLKTEFETKKKEQQILLQENEIIVLEKNVEISNLQKLLLGIGLLLSLIAIGFGWYGFKQKAKRNKVEKAKLDSELKFKKKELTTHALHLAKKNEVLESLKSKAEILKTEDSNNKGYQQLIRAINFDLQDDKNWDNFSRYFEEVHQEFSTKAKQEFPDITANDLRLMALLKMNLSSKEIANILSISSEGIKKARYRLRKKLHLSTQDSLEDFILAFA